jgi:hypothetical protein
VEILARAGWAWLDASIERIDGSATPEDGGTLTIHYRHPRVASGIVQVAITPAGSVRTMHGDRSDERPEQPQYDARILTAEPPLTALDIDGNAPQA